MKNLGMYEAIFFVTIAAISLVSMNAVHVNAQSRNDLDIVWYVLPDEAFDALRAGTIDILQWGLYKDQKAVAEADPNLQVAAYSENDMYEFDIDNNYTIDDYLTFLNPMWVEKCRQAIAFLIDKNYIVNTILEGYGSPIDAPVCYPQTEDGVNASVVTYDWNHNGIIDQSESNYPYKYSVEKAAELLASLGFNDTDGNGYLNYPDNAMWLDAAGIDTTLMPLKICIRIDDPKKFAAGQYLWRQLEGDPALTGDSVLAHAAYWAEHGLVGGDWDTTDHAWEQLRTVLRPIVFDDLNYHIYTGSWSFERLTYFNGLFHSANWDPYPFGGSNYVTGEGPHTRYPSPYPGIDPLPPITPPNHWAHPWLDDVLATGSVPLITGYLVQHIVTIPLWSTKSYIAWRKEVSGVVNMKGVGLINEYTFLNAYRGTSPIIRVGIVFPWEKLNPLYSQWYFEHTLLDRCYTKLIATNPYQLSENIPWVAKDWTVGTWIDPRDGYTKSVVTYYLRENVGCASPITGTLVDTFDARDYEFTCWYNYAFDDSWQQGNFMDLHHLEIVNNHTVKAYFDDENAWFPYLPTYPLLGPTEVLTPKLCTKTSATFHGSDLVRGFYDPSYFEYQFTDECVVHVINATKNGNSIYEGVDFYIRGGYDVNPVHCVFVNKTSFAPTDVIKIFYYYAVPSGAGGIYLGGNLGYDWTDTMYSYGTHYSVSISADSASLKKNPYFFLPKPILGEIDWRYYYQGTTQPRNGYFKIEILDLVKCTSAYCSRGDGQYNPAYFPGADLDSSDLGHIGLLDLVTVTSNYGRQFG